MGRCRLCGDEIPVEEAWSEYCKKCRKRINVSLSKVRRLKDFVRREQGNVSSTL